MKACKPLDVDPARVMKMKVMSAKRYDWHNAKTNDVVYSTPLVVAQKRIVFSAANPRMNGAQDFRLDFENKEQVESLIQHLRKVSRLFGEETGETS